MTDTQTETSWWRYLMGLLASHGWSTGDLVRRTSITHTRISRWRDGGGPSVHYVREVTEVFGRPILEGLVAAEHLSPHEAWPDGPASPTVPDPAALSTSQIVTELDRRLTRLDSLERDPSRHGQ